MNKNFIIRRLISVCLKSFGVIILMIFTGCTSYAVTTYYYNNSDNQLGANSFISNLFSSYTVEASYKNIFYEVNEKKTKIKSAVIEIFNTQTLNLDYVTIPVNGELVVSSEMYHKLYEQNIDVPQIVTLSELGDYFKGKNLFNYATLLLEDVLNIELSCYTAVNSSYYSSIFEPSDENNVMQTFTNDFKTEAQNMKEDEKEIKSFIKELYKNSDSDLIVGDRLKYAEYYSKVSYAYFHEVYGDTSDSVFKIDLIKTGELIEQIISNERYTTLQNEAETTEARSSVGMNIQIYNGANVAGLAKKFQDKLALEGYTITNIYNYDNGIIENTKIISREEGRGLDLLKYFNNAVAETGELPTGVDIMIIIGTNDGN